jgi:tetrahydromethanopterin S-methyltransferase subunit B
MMKKEKMKEDVQSDVSALLSGENLSEEFKEKAATIFEAAVIARSSALMEEVEEALFEEFESAVEQVKEELATKLDDYISYMAEEWVKENQLAIEKGLRAEIVEDFMAGMRNLFIEHYIDIPEDKVDVVEELTNKVDELESQINEQIQSAVELRKELNEHKKQEAIHAVCEGLTQTQVEKMKSLAESVPFTTDEEFADKMVTLRTSYFTESTVKTADSSALNEEVLIEEDKKPTASVDPMIASIAKSISKSTGK